MSVSRSSTAFVTELMLISFLISVYNWPAMFAKSYLETLNQLLLVIL